MLDHDGVPAMPGVFPDEEVEGKLSFNKDDDDDDDDDNVSSCMRSILMPSDVDCAWEVSVIMVGTGSAMADDLWISPRDASDEAPIPVALETTDIN